MMIIFIGLRMIWIINELCGFVRSIEVCSWFLEEKRLRTFMRNWAWLCWLILRGIWSWKATLLLEFYYFLRFTTKKSFDFSLILQSTWYYLSFSFGLSFYTHWAYPQPLSSLLSLKQPTTLYQSSYFIPDSHI